jgi:hypothetical protein
MRPTSPASPICPSRVTFRTRRPASSPPVEAGNACAAGLARSSVLLKPCAPSMRAMSTNRFSDADSLPELIEQIGATSCDREDAPSVADAATERLAELGATDLD